MKKQFVLQDVSNVSYTYIVPINLVMVIREIRFVTVFLHVLLIWQRGCGVLKNIVIICLENDF